MTEPQDEASDSVRAGMRTAMAAAAQVALRVMRALEQRRRETQAASEQRAAELQARFDAERAAARAVLAPVGRDEWWATAQPEQIASAYETAHAWEKFDSEARCAADRIRNEVGVRYGVDPTSLNCSEHLNGDAADKRAGASRDEAAAVAVGAEVASDNRERAAADSDYQAASRQRADALWDSAERRIRTASSLEGKASAEAVNVRMGIDIGHRHWAEQAGTISDCTATEECIDEASERSGAEGQYTSTLPLNPSSIMNYGNTTCEQAR